MKQDIFTAQEIVDECFSVDDYLSGIAEGKYG
jgi:hypothetical protein